MEQAEAGRFITPVSEVSFRRNIMDDGVEEVVVCRSPGTSEELFTPINMEEMREPQK